MSADLSKSLRMAASLSLHELQNMSRGDLMHASSVLHSAWMHMRQQVEGASLRERMATKECDDARRAYADVQEEYERFAASHTRSHAALETKHNALHREHLRLQTLLHKVDGELTSQSSALHQLVQAGRNRQRSLRLSEGTQYDDADRHSYGTDIQHVASDSEDDECVTEEDNSTGTGGGAALVTISVADLDDLLSTIRSSKFRVADLEDSLTLSKSETIKLERVIRQRQPVETALLNFRIQQLEMLQTGANKEILQLTDKLARSEMTVQSLRAELASVRELEEDACGTSPMEHQGSMLSAASWTTATPSGVRRRGNTPRTGSSVPNRSFGARAPFDSSRALDDEAFGSVLSTSTAVQTESLVLQNVELLYKLQRDLMDLRTQREALREEAARHTEEKLTMKQRIETLEHELEHREGQLIDAMEKRKRMPASTFTTRNVLGNTSFSDHSVIVGGDERENVGTPVEEQVVGIHGLKHTIEMQTEEITALKTASFDQVMRIEELESSLLMAKERDHHLSEELRRLSHSLSELTEENARLKLCASLDNEDASSVIHRVQSLRVAETRIGELEHAAEEHETTMARTAALAEEIKELRSINEQQRHRVAELVTERDAALLECQELAELLAASDEAKVSPVAPEMRAMRQCQDWLKEMMVWEVSALAICRDACEVAHQKSKLLLTVTEACHAETTEVRLAAQRRQLLTQRLDGEIMHRAEFVRDTPRGDGDFDRRGFSRGGEANPPKTTLSELAYVKESALGPPFPQVSLDDLAVGNPKVNFSQSGLPHEPLEGLADVPSRDGGGLGLDLIEVEGALVVDTVLHDSPAYHAGLKPTDCVLCVDGAVINTLDEFADSIAGKTECTLSIVSGGGKALIAGEALSDSMLHNLEDVHLAW